MARRLANLGQSPARVWDSSRHVGTVPSTVPAGFKKPAPRARQATVAGRNSFGAYPVVHAGDVRATNVRMLDACWESPPACRCERMSKPTRASAGRDRSYFSFQEHAADPLPRIGTPSCFTSASVRTAARRTRRLLFTSHALLQADFFSAGRCPLSTNPQRQQGNVASCHV